MIHVNAVWAAGEEEDEAQVPDLPPRRMLQHYFVSRNVYRECNAIVQNFNIMTSAYNQIHYSSLGYMSNRSHGSPASSINRWAVPTAGIVNT